MALQTYSTGIHVKRSPLSLRSAPVAHQAIAVEPQVGQMAGYPEDPTKTGVEHVWSLTGALRGPSGPFVWVNRETSHSTLREDGAGQVAEKPRWSEPDRVPGKAQVEKWEH